MLCVRCDGVQHDHVVKPDASFRPIWSCQDGGRPEFYDPSSKELAEWRLRHRPQPEQVDSARSETKGR